MRDANPSLQPKGLSTGEVPPIWATGPSETAA